jgi:hypothetical protein
MARHERETHEHGTTLPPSADEAADLAAFEARIREAEEQRARRILERLNAQ